MRDASGSDSRSNLSATATRGDFSCTQGVDRDHRASRRGRAGAGKYPRVVP